VVHQRADRPDRHRPGLDRPSHVDDERRQAVRPALDLVDRRRACEQQHQVGLQSPRRPDLLAAHDVAAVDALGRRLDPGRVRADGRLGDAEGLEPELARRDAREVAPLLFLRAVPQDRAHHVHLGVARAAVTAGGVDLLENHAGGRQRETRAAVLLGDQRRKPTIGGERLDELLGVAVRLERAPVLAGEAGAQGADGGPDLVELLREREVHQIR
jgi:hypothetical protein